MYTLNNGMEEEIKLNSSHLESDKWVGGAAPTSRSKVRQCRQRNYRVVHLVVDYILLTRR